MPWGRYVVLYGYRETKIYTQRDQIKESTVALGAIKFKLFNSFESKTFNHSLLLMLKTVSFRILKFTHIYGYDDYVIYKIYIKFSILSLKVM